MEYKKTEEIWKDIPGYEGIYQASTLGRIKSLKRKMKIDRNGYDVFYREYDEKVLIPRKVLKGYLAIALCNSGNKKRYFVHRVIATTFINNPNNLDVVNHKDGNKTNNKVENLEWVTPSENEIHSYRVLGKMAKMYPVICNETKRRYSSCVEASQDTGINRCAISHAANGITKSAGGYTWRKE